MLLPKWGIHHEACGLNVPKRYVGPELVEVTLFGRRLFADVIKIKDFEIILD